MTRKLAKWASKRSQTAEFRPSNAGGGKSFQPRRNLGTIAMDLKAIWEMSDGGLTSQPGVRETTTLVYLPYNSVVIASGWNLTFGTVQKGQYPRQAIGSWGTQALSGNH